MFKFAKLQSLFLAEGLCKPTALELLTVTETELETAAGQHSESLRVPGQNSDSTIII